MRQHKPELVWFTAGAQKGVNQPDYALKLRGRWYHIRFDEVTRTALKDWPRMKLGLRRILDYLDRTNKHFSDLPSITAKSAIAKAK